MESNAIIRFEIGHPPTKEVCDLWDRGSMIVLIVMLL